jgi:hypothetical protein
LVSSYGKFLQALTLTSHWLEHGFAKYVLTAEKNKQNSAATVSEALAASQLSLLLFIFK